MLPPDRAFRRRTIPSPYRDNPHLKFRLRPLVSGTERNGHPRRVRLYESPRGAVSVCRDRKACERYLEGRVQAAQSARYIEALHHG